MRKALVIPKAAAAVVCLIVSLVLTLPVLSVMSNRLFGGGSLDFGEEIYSAYRENRPVTGSVHCILGTTDGEDNYYYYLAPIGGMPIDNKNKADTLVLIKAKGGTDLHKELNDVYRASSDGFSETGCALSGVLRETDEDEDDIALQLRSKTKYKELAVSEYVIDLTTPVKSMTVRFALGIVSFVVMIFCTVLTVKAINRNAEVERIEEERFAYRAEQERKSGNKNDDGSDKMFGDSDASFGTTPNAGSASGGYNPTFMSQSGEEFTPRDDSPREIDEDGFLGGGSFFGASVTPAQQGSPEQQGGFMQQSASDPFADSAYGDDDGFFGGQSASQNGGFYGGQSASQNGGFYGGQSASQDSGYDDDGFFVRR